MPDKKLTDSEIVKALECCIEASGVNCGKCPYCDNCVTDENTSLMMTDALDLINRLQGENEAYKHYYNECLKDLENAHADNERLKKQKDEFAYLYDKHINTAFSQIKASAYKECIEKVEEIICDNTYPDFDVNHKAVNIWKAEAYKDINNLLKELVGDKDASTN